MTPPEIRHLDPDSLTHRARRAIRRFRTPIIATAGLIVAAAVIASVVFARHARGLK
jgi:hypothetical protein